MKHNTVDSPPGCETMAKSLKEKLIHLIAAAAFSLERRVHMPKKSNSLSRQIFFCTLIAHWFPHWKDSFPGMGNMARK